MKFVNLNVANEGFLPSFGAPIDSRAEDVRKFYAITARVGLYGTPLMLFIWIWIAFPHIFPESGSNLWLFALRVFGFVLLCPILHELIHLVAIPSKLFHPDSTVFFRINGLRSTLGVRPGGALSREQLIWLTLAPFLFMTVLPFSLHLLGWRLDIALGLMACLNFGLSSADLFQALAYFLRYPKGHRL